MSGEQWVGSLMALAIVLAATNVLVRGVGVPLGLPLRLLQGRRRDAEGSRRGRQRRDEPRSLRSLNPAQRTCYVERWQQVRNRAFGLPATALLDADELLDELLGDIGYPPEGFVLYAADLSAAHADVVDDYRVARSVVLNTRLGLADTAQIRDAMQRYATVFGCVAGADVSSQPDEVAA